MAEEKSEYQKLEEKLVYRSKNIWEEVDKEKVDKIFEFSEGYKSFIDKARSERLTVKWILENAISRGYKNIEEVEKIKEGDLLYSINRNKNIILIKVGKAPIESGINFVVAHGDAPRLDLKQIPLVEDMEIALFKTHYYGGIKKYHWLNIPLCISGVVVTGSNKKIEINVGIDDDDPVFVIPDLLPHLAKKVQNDKKANEFIPAENLNLIVGNIPVKDKKVKEKVKLAVLDKLNKEYGISEEDLISAELEVVPAVKPRDVGFDRSLIAGYGHDDRSSCYGAVMANFEAADSEPNQRTAISVIVDKEEIGSDGPTGAKSLYIFNTVGKLIEKLQGRSDESSLRKTMENSICISADVNAGINPMYKSVHDIPNAAKVSHGVVVTKFTGSGGKYMANDADAELVGKIRNLFNSNGIFWQYGGMGKVDEGGGGTIAKYFAIYNTSVIDCGVPVIGMHSPYEIISKADLYYSFLAYKLFFEKGE